MLIEILSSNNQIVFEFYSYIHLQSHWNALHVIWHCPLL